MAKVITTLSNHDDQYDNPGRLVVWSRNSKIKRNLNQVNMTIQTIETTLCISTITLEKELEDDDDGCEVVSGSRMGFAGNQVKLKAASCE